MLRRFQNESGFFLAETVLSFLVLLFIALVLIPFYVKINGEFIDSKMTFNAKAVLYEQLITAQVEETPIINRSIKRYGVNYELVTRHSQEGREVCIVYDRREYACDLLY